MSTADPVVPKGFTVPMDLPADYDDTAKVALNVSAYDAISLFFDVRDTVTTFSFRLLNEGYLYMRSEGGVTVAEETAHAVANADKFVVRVNTEGVNELELQMKADSATTDGLESLMVAAGGTDNRASHGRPVVTNP